MGGRQLKRQMDRTKEQKVKHKITIILYENGELKVNGPSDMLLTLELLNISEKAIINTAIKQREESRGNIEKPSMSQVIELGRN